MSNLEGPTFNNVNKLTNYYRNLKNVTQEYLLTTGSGLTLDLTGVRGTLKSAIVQTSGYVTQRYIDVTIASTLNVFFILNGTIIMSGLEIARTTQTGTGNVSYNSTGSTKFRADASGLLNLDATNMYTLSWASTGGGGTGENTFAYSNGKLVLTFEPEGL